MGGVGAYLVVDLDGEVDEVGVLLDDLLDTSLHNTRHTHIETLEGQGRDDPRRSSRVNGHEGFGLADVWSL